MKLYEVGPELYVSGWPKSEGLADIQREGITAVICMCRKRTPVEVIGRERVFHYLPVPDGKTVPVEDMRAAVTLINQLRAAGHVVLVHCLQGRNRSMLAAVLAERKRRGWTGAQALEHAQRVRPRCLHNPVFADWLRSLP